MSSAAGPHEELAVLQARIPDQPTRIELLLQRAIDDGLISGGVAVTGNGSGVISVSARGRVDGTKGGALLDENTVFDLASLTKVVATAPAIMKLVQDGKVALSDPLARWFPEFARSRHARVTVAQLLTHTSGLADFPLHRGQAMRCLLRKAAAEKCPTTSGNCFSYADVNFMLLGELVRRASGMTLDVYCRKMLYEPLAMDHTMFLPPRELQGLLAANAGFRAGVVQDTGARRLGSVAGHAGLFSSAHDLSRFARLMLAGGALDGRTLFAASTIAQMTAPRLLENGTIARGLGWDMASPFSAPKGILLSERSFGHTGYSGSSIWIDPESDLFVILLTVRRDFGDAACFNRLRRNVSTVAAAESGRLQGARRLCAWGETTRIDSELLTSDRPKPAASPVAAAKPAGKRAGKHKPAVEVASSARKPKLTRRRGRG